MTYTLSEIEKIRTSCILVSRVIAEILRRVRPGVATMDLDKFAEAFILHHGAKPAFKGYKNYPNSLCLSINEEVVHGIPNHRKLRQGDIVSIDCGVEFEGFYGDSAFTTIIGNSKPIEQKLISTTREALMEGILHAKIGNKLNNIGKAIQSHVEKNGFRVVRTLTGHGIGKNLHEEPQVPNFSVEEDNTIIEDGMVFAIEPMVNMGKEDVKLANDNWTIYTSDRKPSAHFEHVVAIIEGKTEVLTSFDW